MNDVDSHSRTPSCRFSAHKGGAYVEFGIAPGRPEEFGAKAGREIDVTDEFPDPPRGGGDVDFDGDPGTSRKQGAAVAWSALVSPAVKPGNR